MTPTPPRLHQRPSLLRQARLLLHPPRRLLLRPQHLPRQLLLRLLHPLLRHLPHLPHLRRPPHRPRPRHPPRPRRLPIPRLRPQPTSPRGAASRPPAR